MRLSKLVLVLLLAVGLSYAADEDNSTVGSEEANATVVVTSVETTENNESSDENESVAVESDGYTLCLEKGWNLMGTEHDIDVAAAQMFDVSCVDMVFAYDVDGKWRRYSKNGNSKLDVIVANSGFWVKTGYACSITEGSMIENNPCESASSSSSAASSEDDATDDEEKDDDTVENEDSNSTSEES